MEQNKVYHYSLDDIKKIVQQEKIKVVSFDLFDNLLVRPSMRPTDIFYLLEEKVRREYGLDFVGMRLHAEEELHTDDATLADIWNYIGKKHSLNLGVVNTLMNLEIELEKRLLTVRPEMLSVLNCAKKAGKRVIITTDMYLGANILSDILASKGVTHIDAIYVSSDLHARKSDGKLYALIAEKEKVENPAQIVHIGDNFRSDYQMALDAGVTGVYYPSIWEDACGSGRPWERVLGADSSEDPYIRLMTSYAIYDTYLIRGRKFDSNRCLDNLGDVASLLLGNVLLAIAFDLLNNEQIQQDYDGVFFAARDGYLPRKIYDIIASEVKGSLPSHYFQASRQALSYTSYPGFIEQFDDISAGTINQPYRLENYIKLIIVDKSLVHQILSSMTDEERSIDLSEHLLEARSVLVRYKERLDAYFSVQRELAQKYYGNLFPEQEKRYLIFDCGYSGSVSIGLTGARKDCDIKFDKYYIWQTKTNQKRDRENGTKTFCLSPSDDFAGTNLVFEECFSPLEGSCIGFEMQNENVVGVQDSLSPDENMTRSLYEIHHICEDYARHFVDLFKPYLSCFKLVDRDVLTRAANVAFVRSPYMEASLLKPIRFTDSLNGGVPIELSKKLYDSYELMCKYPTVFHGTQFLNPEVFAIPRREVSTNLKIGIHLHIHYLHVLEEFLCYLKDFPAPFDLIITITDAKAEGAIQNLCDTLLPNLKKLIVLAVENRGRDVAPWLVATRLYQKDYDLFCHLHGKASVEYEAGAGTTWRRYLLDNLIGHNAASDIIKMFDSDSDLGCVFPNYDEYVAKIIVSNQIPPIGEFGEQKMIEELMQKMGIDRLFSRDDMLYSCGTMLWYRPNAMKPLFDLKLTTEDFPPEPIINGGTIAHAIERVPGLVTMSQHYTVKIYNEMQPQMLDPLAMLPPPASAAVAVPTGIPFRTWKGHPIKWYIKKIAKSIFPYGVIRLWQRIYYKF